MASRFIYSNQSIGLSFAFYLIEQLSLDRAMFAWVTASSLDTSQARQDLVDFCVAQGVNKLYLDMYNYLGNANYSADNVTVIQTLIESATENGITVYALAGNTDWSDPAVFNWIQTNIIDNINNYNNASASNQKFSGFVLDVEYWLDVGQTAQNALSGLADLIVSMQSQFALPVGCFSAFFLTANADRPDVTYNGISKSEGEHLMDIADFVIVGTFRDTAEFNSVDGVEGQIGLLNPWYTYALANSAKIYMCSELIDISPAYTTYFQESKSYMESQLTISNNYFTDRSVFLGQVIDNYAAWKALAD